MMIVIREQGTHRLIAFGPDNGMYAHQLKPEWALHREENEAAILQEWTETYPPRPDKRTVALADARIPQWFKDWLA
jgi:hypothetical protein